jgi:hypothetical protein
MKVIVKLFGKPLMVANLESFQTIGDLKKAIKVSKQIDIEQQRIVFMREPLDFDHKTLAECNIKDGSVVYLMLRLFVKRETPPNGINRVKNKAQISDRFSINKHKLNE